MTNVESQTRPHPPPLVSRALGWLGRHALLDLAGIERGTLLVAGSARSGTTWVSSAIAAQTKGRFIFEPFVADRARRSAAVQRGPWLERAMARGYSHYLAPGRGADPWVSDVERILAGRRLRAWNSEESARGFYRRRVIKAVRVNLMLGHIASRWPGLPIVWIVRDPVQVVESQLCMNEQGWDFEWEPGYALGQAALMRDWLSPFEDTLESLGSRVERLAARWCVENYVPLRQTRDLHNVVRLRFDELRSSETLWTSLSEWLARYRFVRRTLEDGQAGHQPDGRIDGRSAVPSFTSRSVVCGRDSGLPASFLGPGDHERIMRVVERFGLLDLATGQTDQ
jgi:hypothetical protein